MPSSKYTQTTIKRDPRIDAGARSPEQVRDIEKLLQMKDQSLTGLMEALARQCGLIAPRSTAANTLAQTIIERFQLGALVVNLLGGAGCGKTESIAEVLVLFAATGGRILLPIEAGARRDELLGRLPQEIRDLVLVMDANGDFPFERLLHVLESRKADAKLPPPDAPRLARLSEELRELFDRQKAAIGYAPIWSSVPREAFPLTSDDIREILQIKAELRAAGAVGREWATTAPTSAALMQALQAFPIPLPSAEELSLALAQAPRRTEAVPQTEDGVQQLRERLDQVEGWLSHPGIKEIGVLPAHLCALGQQQLTRAATHIAFHKGHAAATELEGAVQTVAACSLAPRQLLAALGGNRGADACAMSAFLHASAQPGGIKPVTFQPVFPLLVNAAAQLKTQLRLAVATLSMQSALANLALPASAGNPTLHDYAELLQTLLSDPKRAAFLNQLSTDPYATHVWTWDVYQRALESKHAPKQAKLANLLNCLDAAGAPEEVQLALEQKQDVELALFMERLPERWNESLAHPVAPGLDVLNARIAEFRIDAQECAEREQARQIELVYSHARERMLSSDVMASAHVLSALAKTAAGKARRPRRVRLYNKVLPSALKLATILVCDPIQIHLLPAQLGFFDLAVWDEGGRDSWIQCLGALMRSNCFLNGGDTVQQNAGCIGWRELPDEDLPESASVWAELGTEMSITQAFTICAPHHIVSADVNYRLSPDQVRLNNRYYEVPQVAHRYERPGGPGVQAQYVAGRCRDKKNEAEIQWIVADLKARQRQGQLEGKSIAILIMYGDRQSTGMKAALEAACPELLAQTRIGSPRQLQGTQCELVYVSTVESCTRRMGPSDRNASGRWLIATSRAIDELVVVHSLRGLDACDLRRSIFEKIAEEAALASARRAEQEPVLAAMGYQHERVGPGLWYVPGSVTSFVLLTEDGSLDQALAYPEVKLALTATAADHAWLQAQFDQGEAWTEAAPKVVAVPETVPESLDEAATVDVLTPDAWPFPVSVPAPHAMVREPAIWRRPGETIGRPLSKLPLADEVDH